VKILSCYNRLEIDDSITILREHAIASMSVSSIPYYNVNDKSEFLASHVTLWLPVLCSPSWLFMHNKAFNSLVCQVFRTDIFSNFKLSANCKIWTYFNSATTFVFAAMIKISTLHRGLDSSSWPHSTNQNQIGRSAQLSGFNILLQCSGWKYPKNLKWIS